MMAPPPPRFAPPRPPGPRETALQQAAYAMQGGRPAEAERIAGALLQRNPGDAQAAQLYGYALYMQERGADAIAPLERAVQQNRSAQLETQLAMVLRQAGRIDDALKRFARAIKRAPPFPPAFLEYGNLLIRERRLDEAVDVLQQGATLAPNFAEMLTQLGAALAARGKHDAARAAFARAVANAPPDLDTLFSLAQTMRDSGGYAQAAETYRRLLAVAPNETGARVALGICLIESGESEAGYAMLRTVDGADPKLFAQTLHGLASAGHGRFWLKPSRAKEFLKST
jgi:tetratricopeptide (TPR) repeat protein